MLVHLMIIGLIMDVAIRQVNKKSKCNMDYFTTSKPILKSTIFCSMNNDFFFQEADTSAEGQAVSEMPHTGKFSA